MRIIASATGCFASLTGCFEGWAVNQYRLPAITPWRLVDRIMVLHRNTTRVAVVALIFVAGRVA